MEVGRGSPSEEPGGLLPPALSGLASVMGATGAVLILLMALLINWDVLSRFLLNMPIKGVAELVELGIVAIVFVQLPMAIATGGLIRSSELHTAMATRFPRVATAFMLAFELVGAAIFALLCWAMLPRLSEAWIDGLYKGQPGLFTAPTWPTELAIVLGAGASALCFAASFVLRVSGRAGR